MFNIVLFQPEIPPNTGNIIRLCANTGSLLHLIEPLGFELNDKQLKRAGLDYEMIKPIQRYSSFSEYIKQIDPFNLASVFLCTTKAKTIYSDLAFKPGTSFVFGPETRGLPEEILLKYPATQKIKIPMLPHSRSLNLSNSVAIVLYEALRQNQFKIQELP